MRFPRGLAMVAMTVTAALTISAAPAQAAENHQLETAQHVAEGVIGAPTDILADATTIGGYRAQPATVDGQVVDTLITSGVDGFSLMAVMSEGQQSVTYANPLPDGQTLVDDGAGGYTIVAGSTAVGSVAAPWARDANGKALPTRYTTDSSGAITQHVDTTGAEFPVVADPRLTFGLGVYLNAFGREINVLGAALVAAGGAVVVAGCVIVNVPGPWAAVLKLACGTLGATNLKNLLNWIKDTYRNKQFVAGNCYQTKILPANHVWKVVKAKDNCYSV
jgi:hypothetical protein